MKRHFKSRVYKSEGETDSGICIFEDLNVRKYKLITLIGWAEKNEYIKVHNQPKYDEQLFEGFFL